MSAVMTKNKENEKIKVKKSMMMMMIRVLTVSYEAIPFSKQASERVNERAKNVYERPRNEINEIKNKNV